MINITQRQLRNEINRQLAEQEAKLKRSVIWHMSRRLQPVKNHWNSRDRKIRKIYGSKESVKAHQEVGGKLPSATYKDIINTVLRLCRCNKVLEIPDGQITAAINVGKMLVDGYFYKVENKLENDYGNKNERSDISSMVS